MLQLAEQDTGQLDKETQKEGGLRNGRQTNRGSYRGGTHLNIIESTIRQGITDLGKNLNRQNRANFHLLQQTKMSCQRYFEIFLYDSLCYFDKTC